MIELIIVAVAFTLIGVGVGRFQRKKELMPLDSEGWDVDAPLVEAHVHSGHIAGTIMRGGVKHKRMYCSLCPKKWSEPC